MYRYKVYLKGGQTLVVYSRDLKLVNGVVTGCKSLIYIDERRVDVIKKGIRVWF